MKYLYLLLLGCAFPNVSEIDLSACTKACNESSKVCFAAANEAAFECIQPDASNYERNTCINKQIVTAQSCVNNLVECEAQCIEDVERQLGKK